MPRRWHDGPPSGGPGPGGPPPRVPSGRGATARAGAGWGAGAGYCLYGLRVNLGQGRADENALWSFGPHDVSVALNLLGEPPKRVAAQGRSCLQPHFEDALFRTMDFPSGGGAPAQIYW